MLFNNLPEGCFHLQDFLDKQTQILFVELCRELCVTHPLMTPHTKSGYPLALQITSFGDVGWMGDYGKYLYLEKHHNGKPFPPIPQSIGAKIELALVKCGFSTMPLDTVLMNYYPPVTGKLGRHQDVTETDRVSPIVTFSLGDSCIFNIGSEDYDDKGVDIELKSGDAFVMGGASRLAYHGVKKLIPGTSDLLDKGGRISLTGRKVF